MSSYKMLQALLVVVIVWISVLMVALVVTLTAAIR